MNTIATMDEINSQELENPGIQLSNIREQKGYTIEYVASKLHLRTRIIELIENGDFHLLPEPVFIKGYLRAYAKLLGVSHEPFLEVFNAQFIDEKKPERTLWQSKRESHKAEHFIRWFTLLFAVGVMVVVGLWWQNNRDNQSFYSSSPNQNEEGSTIITLENPLDRVKLADVSTIQSLLNPTPRMSPMEKTSE